MTITPSLVGVLASWNLMSGVHWNPADTGAKTGLSNGALTATGLNAGATGAYNSRANSGHSTGKYYFEIHIDSGSGGALLMGICDGTASLTQILSNTDTTDDFATMATNNNCFKKSTSQTAGATFAAGDVLGVAVDLTAGKIWFAKNNTYILSGNPGAGTNQTWSIATGVTYYPVVRPAAIWAVTARFKTASWTYSAPSGFGEW